MQLSLQTFTGLVQNMAAAVQAATSQLIDLTVGSATRALLEANASVALWMQWLILQVLQTTRAATSTGADLDTWMADMSLTRLPAAAASGIVLFGRYTPTLAASIPAGALVRTADGTQTFSVTADATNSAWNALANAYSLSPGVPSLAVPVLALGPGSAGNVQAGAIAQMVSAIPGIDTVTNPAATQNGLDAESDVNFRLRFQNYVQSRSRATGTAIGYAIQSVQPGLDYTVQENVTAAGVPQLGNFVVTVDNGSGAPPPALLAAVGTAVELTRPVGSSFSVQPPSVLIADVSLTLSLAPGAASTAVTGAVGQAIQFFVNGLSIGATLPLTRLAQVAYSTDPSVMNVTGILLNGQPADLIPSPSGLVRAGVVAVN